MKRNCHYFPYEGYEFRFDGETLEVCLMTPGGTKAWVELEPEPDEGGHGE